MKKPILAALALCYALGAAAQTPDTAAPEGYRFTDVKILPVTPVKDQSRSGTCWCYSTLSFLESEILRAGGPELDLSEMWIVRNIYFEKAVKYVRLHGSLNLAVGGQAHDVLHGIEAYGIVPEEVYPGLNYGYDKPNFDEIDAVGRQRGTGLGGGHDEREQTLNQLLVEMDGFGTNQGVVVMAATNRADILDPALLRPGRFDRQVYVGLPDIRGREEILKIHVKNKPLAEDVDLSTVAKGTPGFTGADLENLSNEAALLAARRGSKLITMSDFSEAEIKVIAGPEKKSRVVSEHERKLTAYHEAGHAIVMHALPTHDPVHQITIVPRGGAGGMTISLPTEDRSYQSKRYMEEQIVSLLGGRVAEKLMLGDISTGASNDIQRASQIARKMVSVYGMSDRLGSISFESGHDEIFIGRSMAQAKPYSEQVAAQIDEEVKSIVDAAYERCEDILSRDQKHLIAVAEFLLAHETMSAEEFEAVFTDEAAGHDKI